MDTDDFANDVTELADTETSLRANVGDSETRIRLLELTLADSVAVTRRLSENLITLMSKFEALECTVLGLESKLEHARLYGFSRTADDD